MDVQPNIPAKPPPADEGELDLEALLAGNREEFEKLVRAESPRLYRIILRIVGDAAEAESVMQETYLQAYKRLSTFRRESKFTTWLYAIGINLARAALRKAKRTTRLDEADIERMQPTFSKGMYVETFDAWNPQKLAEREDLKRIVHQAIEKLPDDYKTIVILRDIEEHSTAEAAAVLNITEGAARVRLHRARQTLRHLLDEYLR